MRKNLLLIPVFSLIILMIFPAYAAVDSISLEKPFYTNKEFFAFVGKEDTGKQSVFVVIRGPGGDYIDMASDPSSDNDGSFLTFEREVSKFFRSSGTYNATAFAGDQKEKDGLSILLEYDGTKLSEVADYVLTLKTISDQTITEGKTLSFTVSVTDSSLDDLIFSLEKNPPEGATINRNTGQFIWTPTASQGNTNGVQYNFDIVVEKGAEKDSESITITVKDPEITSPTKTTDEPKKPETPKELGIASFVDTSKDPQHYVDRYNNEPTYKKWFDDNFTEYDSIQQAVGIKVEKEIASFVDPNKDPQHYVDRYNNEPTYKKWFDDNFPEYDSIYQAVGLTEVKPVAAFVDPNEEPQYYVDRYNNEPTYKKWFDDNFPEYDSIYQAVGIEEKKVVAPTIGECGPGTELIKGNCEVVDKPKGGGCLIATAAYGSEMAPQVQFLREIRDNKVMSTEYGTSFMTGFNQFYYSFSPIIADYERENPLFKEAVKIGLTPMISSLVILDYAESQEEILVYGISLIILNVGLYVAAPAMIIYKTGKFVKI